jgi:hypothetical protein
METIFISFPALDDAELFPTIEDAFKKAKYPERVTIGVALLYSSSVYKRDFRKFIKLFKGKVKSKEIKVTAANVFETLGVGKGRKVASDLYSSEDYVLQIDSHTWFSEHWDEKLISLHKDAVKTLGLKKVLLTGYAGHYNYSSEETREPFTDEGRLRFPFIYEEKRFSDIIPNWFDIPVPKDYPAKFIPCVKFNANFSFGDSSFGEYSGVLESAVFFEEELTQTINLVSKGFNLVFPILPEPIICHLYSDHFNEFGGYRPSLADYVSPVVASIFMSKTDENYLSFIKDPSNQKAIQKWEKYAKCSLTFGPLKANHVPEYYINQPDSDLKL